MKNSILILATGLFIGTTVFTACTSSAQKVEDAKENAVEAAGDLNKANEEYMADMEKYRTVSNDKIAANEQNIAQFKKRIEDEKKEAKAEYNKKIEDLEKKNSDIKKKLADYKTDSKANWDLFKAEFNREMDELGNAIVSFTLNGK